mmetsp:Transcript_5199/g.8876  ORF Transcript_5199/g.8876 Transcript_5199/m.8876 type:complete len:270 (+) Transcript_5199:126-935(+)
MSQTTASASSAWVKAAIAFMAIVALWNITKLPFLMSFSNDGNVAYNSRGVELSVNLGHWVKGYRSNKMRTPPCNFMLVHSALGLTILFMMILSLINQTWRKRYCKPFFWFAIIEGIHAIPASLANDAGFKPLFLLACALLVGTGVWGLETNKRYFDNEARAEKHLFIQYTVVTIVNSFAAFLEVPNMISAFKSKTADGTFHSHGDEPHKVFGHTLYDALPEKVGMTIFLGFTIAVWFIWPLLLLDLKKPRQNEENSNGNDTVSEATRLL